LGIPAFLAHHPAHAVGLVPGSAIAPVLRCTSLRNHIPLRKSITALVPARTAFGALQIPNATKTCGFVVNSE